MSKPYLKWVGGKTQLAHHLIARFPPTFNRYLEPFCGSAAMFIIYYGKQSSVDMFDEVVLPPALLNDGNPWLINCHQRISENPTEVIKHLQGLEKLHSKSPKEFYEQIRSTFQEDGDPVQRAAEFIYINKTCFNGLWRVNSKGKFNVPFNQKESLSLYGSDLWGSSDLLRLHATVSLGDFQQFVFANVKKDDFVFLDPPYIPMSATSSFTSYTEEGWDNCCDERLAATLGYIDDIGAKFMMTNSNAPLVYEFFGKWNIETVKAHRFVKAINSEKEKRKKVDETIIRNYQ